MKTSYEVTSFRYALLTGLSALGGAGMLAVVIPTLPNSILPRSSSEASFSYTRVTPELLAQGQTFFALSCSECHGDDAKGDEGPDLHNLPVSNAYIRTRIKKGLEGEMPPFAKKYNDRQIAALIVFLRSLR